MWTTGVETQKLQQMPTRENEKLTMYLPKKNSAVDVESARSGAVAIQETAGHVLTVRTPVMSLASS